MVKKALTQKAQKVPNISLDRVQVKNRNWKSKARVRYVRTKRYVHGSKQRKVTTGIMECGNKQFRFNIWSDKGIKAPLEENQIYSLAHGQLDEKGIFNFGQHSIIQKCMELQEDNSEKIQTLTVTQLLHLNQQKTIDFQGYIQWAEKPYQWLNKQTGTSFMKQNITVVDVIQRFSINVTLWDKFITKQCEGSLCKFNGFRIKLYGGARVISSTVYSTIQQLPDFVIPADTLQAIQFTTLSENYHFRNFQQLEQILDGRQDNQCFYTKIIAQIQEVITQTPFYIGCPQCCCKIEQNNYCQKCEKKIIKPVVRFILQLVVNDGKTSIRVKLFHRISQHLLSLSGSNLTAEQFEKMSPESTKTQLQNIVGLKLKFGISSSVVVYKQQKYNKHTVLELYTA